ncbi:MAG: hypothetical protein C4326_14795 [Ignavibacteria bacterium]
MVSSKRIWCPKCIPLRVHFQLKHYNDAILAVLCNPIAAHDSAFVTIDAPIVCPNRTGTRPVDRLTHTMFDQEHAACHPANLTTCPRPVRIRRKLERPGFATGWDIGSAKLLVAEVYPHPAIVRLFRLPRIIKYNKERVTKSRREFARYQPLTTLSLQPSRRRQPLHRQHNFSPIVS